MRRDREANEASKPTHLLEWQTCNDDREWQTLQSTAVAINSNPQPAHKPPSIMRHWQLAMIVLFLLIGIGGWTWYQAEQGLAQIEAEVGERVTLDLWKGSKVRRTGDQPFTLNELAAHDPLTSTVELLALPGDTAIVRLIIPQAVNQPALRQTRLYQNVDAGWVHMPPTPARWGSPRRQQTKHFDFHYYAQDELAVSAVTATIDDLYESLTINFPRTTAVGVKIRIEVDPSQPYGVISKRPSSAAPLVVASPAIYLAPVELSEAELLAQSIVLALLKESQAEAIEGYAVPDPWRAMVGALHLWQLWQLDLPLATWREPLQQRILAELELQQGHPFSNELSFYAELCGMHNLWMGSPLDIQVPLRCDSLGWDGEFLTGWQSGSASPLTLSQLISTAMGPFQWQPYPQPSAYPGSALVLTTLFDYAASTYGRERLSLLVTMLHDYPSWQTLTPAVFGVSDVEFELGWRNYLVRRYHISCALAALECVKQPLGDRDAPGRLGWHRQVPYGVDLRQAGGS